MRNLTSMFSTRSIKSVPSLAVTVALAMFGIDCLGMTRPEQAMQCCEKMHCHPHHHSPSTQDCCKTALQMQTALGQPLSMEGMAFLPVTLGVRQLFTDSHISEPSLRTLAGHFHDPPLLCSAPVQPLRI